MHSLGEKKVLIYNQMCVVAAQLSYFPSESWIMRTPQIHTQTFPRMDHDLLYTVCETADTFFIHRSPLKLFLGGGGGGVNAEEVSS